MLLLVLAVSALGLNVATPGSAQCGQCGTIYDSLGRPIGYGCISGGTRKCTATSSGCTAMLPC
jgi:tRNA(Ile2) C34 agmatinyltransferase TiaS